MKKKHQVLIAAGLAGFAAGYLISELLKHEDNRKKLAQIAEEGYETALDVLFPEKEFKNKKLHFGPVIPEL